MLENFRLTVFRAVAAQRSFRRAAEQLYLTQPAVTQQIKALEELVGLPLFDRSGREITLTTAGAVLLKHAEQSCNLLEQGAAELAALKGQLSGTLRIAASTTIAQYILPPLLGAFLRLHPALHVELDSSNTESVVDAIATGRASLGLVEGPPHAGQVRSEIWLEDELVLLVPPGHEWAAQRSITLQQIAAAPLLMRERGSGTREVIETTLEAAALVARDLHIAMELNSTEAILGCIESGVGVGFVSRSAVRRQLVMGTLTIVPVTGLTIPRNLLLLTPAGPEPTGAAAAISAITISAWTPFSSSPDTEFTVTSVGTKRIFLLSVIIAASGLISPAVALAGGIAFGLLLPHPFASESRDLSRLLLQASVVALGFGMNLRQVVHAGASGFVYTAVSIAFACVAGILLGRILSVHPKAAFLITCGTAICGGSAIAAIAPITRADDEDMAVSLGTVFTLNAIALLAFPIIGFALHLTQPQFGLWAALAIHDTSSVVGAAAHYGPQALTVGTTVKLVRALWIVPVALATAAISKSSTRIQWPWFILYFCLAAVANTYIHAGAPLFAALAKLGRNGLTVTLFLIGSGISKATLRKVGVRPMLQGVVLWIIIATLSLWAIRSGLIGI
jgi:uncharacterized integral membrane protein (TIGR00698 family)